MKAAIQEITVIICQIDLNTTLPNSYI